MSLAHVVYRHGRLNWSDALREAWRMAKEIEARAAQPASKPPLWVTPSAEGVARLIRDKLPLQRLAVVGAIVGRGARRRDKRQSLQRHRCNCRRMRPATTSARGRNSKRAGLGERLRNG